MTEDANGNVVLERGVWAAPYTNQGCRVLIAIDSTGAVRRQVRIRSPANEAHAVRMLTALLDRIDPQRPRLVI